MIKIFNVLLLSIILFFTIINSLDLSYYYDNMVTNFLIRQKYELDCVQQINSNLTNINYKSYFVIYTYQYYIYMKKYSQNNKYNTLRI